MKAQDFIFSACILFSSLFAGLVNAVTVSVVPGKSVGLGDSYYWAGIVTLNIDGVEYPAMASNWYSTLTENPSTITGTWETTLWTQNDIDSGVALVGGTSEVYHLAAPLFLYAMLGYYTNDPLWTAGHNEMVWNTLMGSPWDYGDRVYDPQTGITMHDVYQYNYIANGLLDPNYDYSGFMQVLQANGTQINEFLVYTGGPIVPVPPAVWLFGSGLIGLMAAARKQTAGMACGKMKAGCCPV